MANRPKRNTQVYPVTLDDKNRIWVPVILKPRLQNKDLMLFPNYKTNTEGGEEFRMLYGLTKLESEFFDDEFLRDYLSLMVTKVKMDSRGRIPLNEKQKEHIGYKKSKKRGNLIVIVHNLETPEIGIWDTKHWSRYCEVAERLYKNMISDMSFSGRRDL